MAINIEETNGQYTVKVIFGDKGDPGKAAPILRIQYSSDEVSWHDAYQEGDTTQRQSTDGGVTWSASLPLGIAGPRGEDGDNAPLLQIQYSGDGSTWHDDFVEGDTMQRQSTDGGVTWSNAIPFGGVGSGGHTIKDSEGTILPTQPVLKFGAGFLVEDETGETVVSFGSDGAGLTPEQAADLAATMEHIDWADEEKHTPNQIAGLIPVTTETPTAALKFEANRFPDETRHFNLSDGDLTLSLDTSVNNIVGNCNFFDVIADGVHSINIGTGFKSNGIFPSTLDGTILEAGTYLFFCIFSANGIVVNVPALGGSGEVIPDTPPYATNVYFTGQPVVGQTMTGQYTFNGDSVESGTTYKWYRADDNTGTNRAAISGAIYRNYVVQYAYETKYLQFGVTPINADGTGIEVLSNYSRAITLTDTFAPEIKLAIIEDSNPNVLKLVFDENVTATNLGYTVKYDTITQTINSISGSGTNELLLNINRTAQSGEVVTLDYDSLVGDTVDANANELVSFTDKNVTNEVLSSILSGIPYNSDLIAMFEAESLEVDDISGNITKIVNPINYALSFECSSDDSLRPTISGNEIATYDKIIKGVDAGLAFKNDANFSAVFLIDFSRGGYVLTNRLLKLLSLPFMTNRSGYFNDILTQYGNEFLSAGLRKHYITITSDDTITNVYLDDNITPMATGNMGSLIVSNILSQYSLTGEFALPSKANSIQSILIYNRKLSLPELNIVRDDYLAPKFDVYNSERPVVTGLVFTNLSENVTLGDILNYTLTYTSTNTIERVIFSQMVLTAYPKSGAGIIENTISETSLIIDSPFLAAPAARVAVTLVDSKGLASVFFIGSDQFNIIEP